MANAIDPSAPQPNGQMITPCRSDFPGGTPALPRSIDSLLFKWANTQPKAVAAVQMASFSQHYFWPLFVNELVPFLVG
jgi:hypothetical protein